ncbi:efflux transporter outer membrane subunit [Oryzomonas japonica]|uniref:Efflux transporter outer membrane subunit n=1 Tax=Oryzomonas japonica TaxID=2603858 RepID=A0A7J4ZNQ3_9BACT|nr:efflux transporter outer membrane subunit [Oryzomonas japonica]
MCVANCLKAALVLIIGGCASLPHNTPNTSPRSRMLDPNQLNAGSTLKSAAKQPTPWPSQQWWKAYADPQLDRLVEEATSGNPSIRMAQARVAKAQALSGIAGSALLPSLQADAAFTREQFTEHQFIPPPYAGNWSWNNRATLDLFYELDLWGKNRKTLAASLDYVQVATAEAQEIRLALQTTMVRFYVQLSLQHVLLDIARSTLRQRQNIFDITRKRLTAGLATELDLRQTETPLPAARAEIERISESIELLRNQLSALTGKGPGDGESIHRPSLSLNVPIGLPAVLPADLLGRRPDVVAQCWLVEAAGNGIDVAKAAFYPNINLTAFAGWQSLSFAQFLSPGSLIAGFGPAISLPIFEGGRLRSQLAVSTADYDIAVESYNSTLIRALENVANQIVTLRSLETQRRESNNAHDLANRTYDIALQAFRSGMTDYFNVLNAQNQTLIEAQRKAQVEARFLDAYAALMQAIGGGIPVTPPQAKGMQQ